MKALSLLRVLIVIIIIIGGVIIIIIRVPIPEPQCIVCGTNLVRILGIAEIVLGAISLGLVGRLKQTTRIN